MTVLLVLKTSFCLTLPGIAFLFQVVKIACKSSHPSARFIASINVEGFFGRIYL